MPALLNLVANRPQLLTEHAEAYAALVASEGPACGNDGRCCAHWRDAASLWPWCSPASR